MNTKCKTRKQVRCYFRCAPEMKKKIYAAAKKKKVSVNTFILDIVTCELQ